MLCCICLLQQSKTLDVFDETIESLNIAEIINQHFWFKPMPDKYNTTHICFQCWNNIKVFHDFYQTVKASHSLSLINVEENPNTVPIKQETETFGANTVDVHIHDCDEPEIIDINRLETQDIKDGFLSEQESDIENTECSFNQDNSDESEADSICAEEIKTKDKKLCNNINVNKKSKCVKKVMKQKIYRQKEKKRKVAITTKWTDKFLDPILTEQMIKKHINMICDLCVFVGSTFPDMVSHYKEYHPKVRPYIMCCDRKFTKRYYVAQHALKHEDPNYFRCEQCNKSFTTTCSLRTHNLSYHAPEEELLHSCDTCPRKFARRNLLELHRPAHIPKEEWTFFCAKCPRQKAFATAYLLNIHNSMHNKKAANICHVCAKEIKDKHAFEKHVRLHFEDSGPRLKCPYSDCDSWLKDEDNLKSHLQRHNPEGKIYKCPDCGKLCKNRGALTNHKRYSHSNEVFQCEECDKTFKKAISLKEHMTKHTGETLYKCPFCTRTFNSNANLYSHKKKQHPLEWDEWRKNKKGSSQSFISNTNSLLWK